MRNSFSCKIWGAKEDKDMAHRLVAHSNSNFILNLNGQLIILIHSIDTLKWSMEKAWREKKIHEKFLLMNSNGCNESEVAHGDWVKVVSIFKPT